VTRPAIAARGLTRRFGPRDVVAGIDLEIASGEWMSLVGASGCGKTTLLQMLGLLDRPDAGSVLLEGADPWSWDQGRRADARLARIGFVFQTHNLVQHLTTRENVALPRWRLGGSRAAGLREADKWLERFGLTGQATTLAARLSIGESQRTAIARALVNRPAIVLADEPTGSLDSENGQIVLDALGQACAEGAALLVVTHDPGVASRGPAVSMRDGRIGK
jgi:ABC-type lipoprotein export system ATPase subunit